MTSKWQIEPRTVVVFRGSRYHLELGLILAQRETRLARLTNARGINLARTSVEAHYYRLWSEHLLPIVRNKHPEPFESPNHLSALEMDLPIKLSSSKQVYSAGLSQLSTPVSSCMH
jgi:hypothetical protein